MQGIRNRIINILKQRTPFDFLIHNIRGLLSYSLSSLPFFYKNNCSFFWLIRQSAPSWLFSSLSLDYQLGQSRFFLLDWKKNLSHFSRTSVSIHTTSVFRTKRFLAPVLSGGEQPFVGQHRSGHTPVRWGLFMAQPLQGPMNWKKRAQVCYSPSQGSICNWVRSFLPARAGGLRGQGLPATVPGHSPCWSHWSCTHPSASGSLWLDDLALFFKLQIELGKQTICNFGMTFLVCFTLYTSAAVMLVMRMLRFTLFFFFFNPSPKFSFEN